MNSLNPTKPIQLMKPEGSRKIVVLNGSRQIDQVVRGEWITLKVLPENGLPRGIFQLSEAGKPDRALDNKRKEYPGQILHVDAKSVFQLCVDKIIEHDRAAFKDMETASQPLTVGVYCRVSYLNGQRTANRLADYKEADNPISTGANKSKTRGHGL